MVAKRLKKAASATATSPELSRHKNERVQCYHTSPGRHLKPKVQVGLQEQINEKSDGAY